MKTYYKIQSFSSGKKRTFLHLSAVVLLVGFLLCFTYTSRVQAAVTGTVTASTLFVRTGPSTEYAKVQVGNKTAYLSRGDKVAVDYVENGWYYVTASFEGTRINGFVSALYVEVNGTVPTAAPTSTNTPTPTPTNTPTPTPADVRNTPTPVVSSQVVTDGFPYDGVVTATRLNVRRGAGTDKQVLAVVVRTAKVKVLGAVKDSAGDYWYQISYTQDGVTQTGYVHSKYISIEQKATPTAVPATSTPRPTPTAAGNTPTPVPTSTPVPTPTAAISPSATVTPAPTIAVHGDRVTKDEVTDGNAVYYYSGVVTAYQLNLREGASAQTDAVAVINQNTQVLILNETVNGSAVWYRVAVKQDGKVIYGYMLSKYVRLLFEEEIPALVIWERVKLRNRPSTTGAYVKDADGTIITLNVNENITICGETTIDGAKWFEAVTVRKGTAYHGYIPEEVVLFIMKTVLTPSPTPEATPSPTPPSVSPTEVPQLTPTPGATITPGTTPSPTPGATITPEATPSPTPGMTVTPEATPSPTPGMAVTLEATPSPTSGITVTPEATPTITPKISPTVTATPEATPTEAPSGQPHPLEPGFYPINRPGTVTGYGVRTTDPYILNEATLITVYEDPYPGVWSMLAKDDGYWIILDSNVVFVLYEKYIDSSNNEFYHLGFYYKGKLYYGYLMSRYIVETTEEAFLNSTQYGFETENPNTGSEQPGTNPGGVVDMTDFEAYLDQQGFPESYKSSLRELHAQYPNWVFEAYHTGLDWETVLEEESIAGKNLIPNSKGIAWKSLEKGAYQWETDSFIVFDGTTWVTASRQAVAYYMDPRNFLNDTQVFMFEVLRYAPSYQDEAGVENVLLNTPFSHSSYAFVDEDGRPQTYTYAQTFMKAAEYSGVSPYHLAARVKQEVVTSSTTASNSVSGTVKGLEGLYNFYNIGAYHSTVAGGAIANGLKYAKNGASNNDELNDASLIPWTNQYNAIVGGAYILGSTYINRGQDTIYLQKFNVTENSTYYHQYMANVEAPAAESKKTSSAYHDVGELPIVFSIPVYLNMPEENAAMPGEEYNPNNWLKSLQIYDINGNELTLTPTFNATVEQMYYLVVDEANSVLQIEAKAVSRSATVLGSGVVAVDYGTNVINIVVMAENGDIREYIIVVVR